MNKLLAALLACIAMPTNAALFDRGGGLIYDDVLNITWLQDANYAKTSGYDADGKMTWDNAKNWAANLKYYDSVRDVNFNDWRLPTVNPINGSSFDYSRSVDGTTDDGFSISKPGTAYAGSTGSEMAYMYYVNLSNPSYYTTYDAPAEVLSGCYVSAQDTCLDNVGPFANLNPVAYWSNSEYPVQTYAWVFDMETGYQSMDTKDDFYYAWAVRPGDVAAIPEPSTYVLMLAGLGLVGMAARRNSKQAI